MSKSYIWLVFSLQKIISVGYCPHVYLGWLLPTQEALVYMMSMRMNEFCVWFSLQKIISVGYCPHVPMGWLLPTQAALVYITLPSLLGM